MDSAYYERYMLSSKKPLPDIVPQNVRGGILDTYVLEFLDLPAQYSEQTFKKAIIANLKKFILEFGKDFSLIGEEYRVQVGGSDFYIDLPFTIERCPVLCRLNKRLGSLSRSMLDRLISIWKPLTVM